MKSRRGICCGALIALGLSSLMVAAQTQPAQAPSSSTPATAAEQSKSAEAAELVKQGEKLNADGKPDEAFALYQRALEVDPELYQAQLFMGVALDLQGRFEEARQHLAKALQLASQEQTVQALRVMAVSYAFERNTEKASEYERRAVDLLDKWKHYADAAATADELARIYLESGDLNNAYKWYQTGNETALKIPDLTPAQKNLWEFRWLAAQARIAARRGQKEQAQQFLAGCKAILDKNDNPDQGVFYPYLAGYVAFYTGDYSTAIKQLQLANQKDPFVLCLQAQTYQKLGDLAHAKGYYQKVLKINTHNPSNAFARPVAQDALASSAMNPPVE
jgi:tetratricopeptide (TPR) repeat protein